MLVSREHPTSTPLTSLPIAQAGLDLRTRKGGPEGASMLKEAPRGENTRRRLGRQVGPKPKAVRGEQTGERLNARTGERTGRQVGTNGVILFFVALFVVSLFYVWANTQVVRGTYAVSELKKKHKELSAENERLKLEISTLSAPATLHQVAVGTLALVPPAADQIVMVK